MLQDQRSDNPRELRELWWNFLRGFQHYHHDNHHHDQLHWPANDNDDSVRCGPVRCAPQAP